MFQGLQHLHSSLRYVVVFLLIVTVINAFLGWSGKKVYTAKDNKLSLFAMIFCHIQLLVGIGLYFISPIVKVGLSDMGSAMADAQVRFFTVEHALMMIIALTLVTIGRSTSKKQVTDNGKFKRVAIFYGLGLLIIFFMIPWPFLRDFGTWF
ncbi:MAG: cytochrome B [Bacteroidota bacterium]